MSINQGYVPRERSSERDLGEGVSERERAIVRE